ncbi:MAG: hypothetical protein ACXVRK_00655 [Gaiellaceae bacterium]
MATDDQSLQDAIDALTDNDRTTLARDVWGYIAPPVDAGQFAQHRIAELRDRREVVLTADLEELTVEELRDLGYVHQVLTGFNMSGADWLTLGVNLYLMVFAGVLNDELRRRNAQVISTSQRRPTNSRSAQSGQ